MWISVRDFIETYIELIDQEKWEDFLEKCVNEDEPLNDKQFLELENILGSAGIKIPEQIKKDIFLKCLDWNLSVYISEEEVLPIVIFLRKYFDCRLGYTEDECAHMIEENLQLLRPSMSLIDQYGSGNLTQYLIKY